MKNLIVFYGVFLIVVGFFIAGMAVYYNDKSYGFGAFIITLTGTLCIYYRKKFNQ